MDSILKSNVNISSCNDNVRTAVFKRDISDPKLEGDEDIHSGNVSFNVDGFNIGMTMVSGDNLAFSLVAVSPWSLHEPLGSAWLWLHVPEIPYTT